MTLSLKEGGLIRYRCLVTGGAGFIGSHVVSRLLGLGHEVVCLDNFNDYYDVSLKEANVEPFLGDRSFTLAKGDITDMNTVKKHVEGADFVFHNAARAGVAESFRHPLETHMTNTAGTLNVLEAIRGSDVKKLIFASSSSIYGKVKSLPIKEDHPARPISPYGVSKLCCERYCEVYHDVYGIDYISLRYFTVFGPRMRPDLAISIFTGKALAGEDIVIFGDGSKSRDFTFVDNIVDANVSAMTAGSGAYNVGGGRDVTIEKLAETIIDLAGSKSRIVHKEGLPGDMEHTLADISRARRDLGYEPAVSVDEGLRIYVDLIRRSQYSR